MRPQAGRASCPQRKNTRRLMYDKPTLERFGTLRDLTLYGAGGNGDGGIWGIGWINGSRYGGDVTATDTSRS